MSVKDEIRAMTGAEEIQAFAEELMRVGQIARERRMDIEMPAVILVTEEGMGNTTALRKLAGLLKEEKLLRFSGEEDLFEWRMLRGDEDGVTRLLSRMEQAAGFYPYFSGVVGLDLSDFSRLEMLDGALLELIRERRKTTLFCLMITPKQAAELDCLRERLMNYSRVRVLRINPDREALNRFVKEELQRQGFTLDETGEQMLNQLTGDRYVSGYRGLRLAVNEMIWTRLMENGEPVVTARDIQRYREMRQSQKEAGGSRRRVIGFGAQDK